MEKRRASLPKWLARPIPAPGKRRAVTRALAERSLETVCERACCPNRGECYGQGTATFMILGSVCTRECRFCAVPKGMPRPPDPAEPEAVAAAVAEMGLDYAVVTSVTRDDIADGGAAHFAATIAAIRKRRADCSVEVLTPDFCGSAEAVGTVVRAEPSLYNHNVETVPRLYARVRPGAEFARSIALLTQVKKLAPRMTTKSGLMVGLGEARAEVIETLARLRQAGCDALTIGQYLAPKGCLPVERYLAPEEFGELAEIARSEGFTRVASGPLVRSSYRAAELAR